MKTFKWTVPELRRTKDEARANTKNKKPQWFGWFLAGTFFLLIGIDQFPSDDAFSKGIRTYFWNDTIGTVISNDLRKHSRSNGNTVSGFGEVAYFIYLEGLRIEGSDRVFKRWDGDTEGKYEEWASQFQEGKTAKIYYSDHGETSLGSWPASYAYRFGIESITNLLLGFWFFYRGTKVIRSNRNERTLSVLDELRDEAR
jgi:hypothetical protein